MLMIGSNEIGGGYVRLGFMDGERYRKAGEPLTADEIKSWAMWKTLYSTGKITIYPPPPKTSNTPSNVVDVHPRPAERHVISTGFGRFDVFEGHKVNDKAMSKDEAEALAAIKN